MHHSGSESSHSPDLGGSQLNPVREDRLWPRDSKALQRLNIIDTELRPDRFPLGPMFRGVGVDQSSIFGGGLCGSA